MKRGPGLPPALSRRQLLRGVGGALAALGAGLLPRRAEAAPAELLNVSYDVARELFAQLNPLFTAAWQARTGQRVEIRQSHGGSSAQARAVAEGLQADVVTLNQVTDILFLQKSGLVGADWRQRFPDQASPYYSLPAFLVRAGNPRGIRDWDDLGRAGVQVVLANPKTSGNGRYAYLGAWAYALERPGGNESGARDLVSRILANAPVLDTGGRGATTTFVERGVGDVLVTFEAEVHTIVRDRGRTEVQIVVPPTSVQADFPVAVIDQVAGRHGTRELAAAYLQFLYGDTGQDVLARNFYRVRSPAVARRHREQFPDVRLLSIEQKFGGWEAVTQRHFADGALLDQILARAAKG